MLMRPDLRTQQRNFLLQITRAITAQLDLDEVLRRVIQASLVMLAGRVAIIALDDRQAGGFTVRAYSGIAAEDLPPLNQKLRELMRPLDEGRFSREFLNSKLREIANSIDSGLAQSIAMPLVFASKPLGLLIVFRSYQTEITREDLSTLQSFADQAAIAVNNAQLYGELNREHQRLEAILNNSGDGVFILDAEQTVQQANRAFGRITGWTAEEALQQPIQDILDWQALDMPDLQAALAAGWARPDAPLEPLYVEGDLRRRDGSSISIGITYAPLLAADGSLESIIANVRDISNFRMAQELQSVFISTVQHELRTPIAIIKGYASTLSRDDVDWSGAVMRKNLAIIEEEADRLTNLVEDLLTASKIQAERELRLSIADADIKALATQSADRLKSQTDKRIELSFPEAFPLIQGDAARLRQVIDNLLTNAIKYSPADAPITVGGRYTEKSVILFVRDKGAGIPKDQIDKIFDRFYRVDNSLTRQTQGAGLGLFLAKAIIEAHKGEISVRSQVGSGATFYFTLPRD